MWRIGCPMEGRVMPQSFASLFAHGVFSTKQSEPWLTPELRDQLHPHIGSIVRTRKCALIAIGGVMDHAHLLVVGMG